VAAATDQSVYRAGWTVLGSNSGKGKGFSLLQNRPYLLKGPRSLIFSENQDTLPGVKRPGREVNLYPSNVEVKMAWRYTSPPTLYFRAVDRSHLLLPFKFVVRNVI
jgi:hypothetical protein